MELTIDDLRQLMFGDTERLAGESLSIDDPLDPQAGDRLIIRTVTMTLTGEVRNTSATWIVLDQAAWIADSGRWADAIATGYLLEVEPMGNNVRVARAAIIDVTPWRHALPMEQK